LVIEDNGRGFDRPPGDAGADGLRNMRQRVAEIGGECRIETRAGAGTKVTVVLAKGYLYKEIADQLGISLSTVRAHLHAVYEKLHVQSRTQAVVKFLGQE